MNEVARVEPQQAQRLSIVGAMANRFSMEADTFMATLKATVIGDKLTREEQAAFLLVAWEHRLNPITREIYAMPKKGGGIIPVVSIDGWVRLANEHPAFDGMAFETEHSGNDLVSITCKIHRKDRAHPIEVTEFFAECKRPTEPWKDMPRRMLRHKAMIQCARYAFGFAGIYDPDEAERFAAPLNAEPEQRRAPSPSAAPMIEARAEAPAPRADMVVADGGAIVPETERQPTPASTQPTRRAPSPSAAPSPQPEAVKPAQAATQPAHYDPEKVRAKLAAALKAATTGDAIEEAWLRIVDQWDGEIMPPDREDFAGMCRVREGEISDGGAAP